MTAILDPVTLRDVEHWMPWMLVRTIAAMDACVDLARQGRVLEATAGMATIRAYVAERVAREKRRSAP